MRLFPRLYSYSYQRYGGKGTLAATKVAIRHPISDMNVLQPIGIGYSCFSSYYTTSITNIEGCIIQPVYGVYRPLTTGKIYIQYDLDIALRNSLFMIPILYKSYIDHRWGYIPISIRYRMVKVPLPLPNHRPGIVSLLWMVPSPSGQRICVSYSYVTSIQPIERVRQSFVSEIIKKHAKKFQSVIVTQHMSQMLI